MINLETKEYFIPALALEFPHSKEDESKVSKIRNALLRLNQHEDFFTNEPVVPKNVFILSTRVCRDPLGYLVVAKI